VAVIALAGYASGETSRTSATLPSALALQQQFKDVVKQVGPSVVQIETGDGLGSGIVFDAKGDIVTNAHVVGTASSFKVTLSNGKALQATLVGTFVPGDLAVIKVDPAGLKPARFADSSKLAVGDIVMAIGNPLGFQSSVTEGIVSGLGRTVSEPNGSALPDAIQTSAPINPGNSGGALVDIQGRVVGVPTLGASSGNGNANGIGFAVPSNTVSDIAQQLVKNGKVLNSRRAYLGVRIGEVAAQNGVLVGEVTPGSAAAKAGIRSGDLIVSVAGKPTNSPTALAEVLATLKPGQQVKVGLSRNGAAQTVTVTLDERPAS
jgi:putative serine protease PepD